MSDLLDNLVRKEQEKKKKGDEQKIKQRVLDTSTV
jgi:hypothetical protein